MSMNLKPEDVKEKIWILWRWKGERSFGKSFIQAITTTEDTALLDITDSDWYVKHPLRVLLNEIDVIIPKP